MAKGVVYALIGFFAAATLIGISKSGANGPKAVIEWLGDNTFGSVLLGLIGVGLLCYSVWRLYKAGADTENEGHDQEGTVKRIAWACSGLAYATLAVFAFREIFRGGGSKGGKQDLIADILAKSWGPYVVGVLCVIFIGVALYQAYRGFSGKHMEKIKTARLDSGQESAFRTMGYIGLLSRAVIYGIIAYFLGRAALMDDPSQFKGIGDSLQYLDNAAGKIALVVVGLGLLAYGLFMFVRARYERV